MNNTQDFRPFVPTLDYPRVAAMQGRDAQQHAAAGLANPVPQELLFKPWELLYREPFKGITSNGEVIEGLYQLEANQAPSASMVAATLELLVLVSDQQKQQLVLPCNSRQWRHWNNTEIYIYQYGLRLEEVSLEVREAMLAVLRASLSDAGYEKTRHVMRINHFLGELTGNTRVLGEWSYNFTLFGEPSATEPWGWQLMGHHLALNCMVLGGQMVLTPTFMGAEPNTIDTGPFAGTRLFEDEENLGLELMRSLSMEQRNSAILFHSVVEGDLPAGRRHKADQLHLGGALQDNRVIPYEGIQACDFTVLQREKLLRLINAYIETLPQGPRTVRIDEITRHLEQTYFAWIGGFGEEDTFYYRIQSPVIMIEFDHHSGVFLTNEMPAKFHIHTIVRTPNGNDYGADLLRMHYAHQHHTDTRPGHSGQDIGHQRARQQHQEFFDHLIDHDHKHSHP
ncbi:MAG: DUF3500 domain-containing protein [Burkholderiaceae bacterium]